MTDSVGDPAEAFTDGRKARVPTASRTFVIVLSQVVVIVALVVFWSVLRKGKTND